jgi:CBS-domain-containing membrane protein
VLEAGTTNLIVTYPDELLDQALEKMVSHDLGRLPVVDRREPTRLLGYLGRTGIASGWRIALEEEQVRDDGWLAPRRRTATN